MDFAKSLAAAIVLIISTAVSSFACDCLTLSEEQSFQKATLVFTGRVIDVQTQGQLTIFTFRVDQSFKGDNTGEVKITSWMSNCDAQFYLGWKYIVYAQRAEDRYFAGSCLSTKALEVPPRRCGTRAYTRADWYRSIARELVITALFVLASISTGLLLRVVWKRSG